MTTTPSTPKILLMAGGAVLLLGSFLDFAGETSAWGEGAFPIATLPALLGAAIAVVVALATFANATLSERPMGFTWSQVYVVVGSFVALQMVGWLITEGDKEAGFFLMFVGAGVLFAGALMHFRESPAAAGPGTAPPTPF
ncbi:MAG: hypothetical protein ACT4PW_07365 [Acidimicrobiia bacterium]